MSLPKYLEGKYIPRHVQIALDFMGVAEIKGKMDNPIIMGWAKELGLEKIYTSDDSTPWCGLFAAIVLKRVGRDVPTPKDKYDYLRALKYASYGNHVMPNNVGLGDILVFSRTGGGHVGFYVAESKNTYFCIGGNQGDKVSIVEISKMRCSAIRRPLYNNYSPEPIVVGTGGKLSTNEA